MRCSGLTGNQNFTTNEQECIKLGLSCADICTALERGMDGKKLEDLSQPMFEAVQQLTA